MFQKEKRFPKAERWMVAARRDRQGWCTDWLARSGWQKFAEGREKGGRREEEGRQEQGRGREEEGGREVGRKEGRKEGGGPPIKTEPHTGGEEKLNKS